MQEIERFLQDMNQSLEQGLIPARIFNDPEIHRLELERVFARAWIFVGHESEGHGGCFPLRMSNPYMDWSLLRWIRMLLR